MRIVAKIKSKTDDVTKYVLLLNDGLVTEFSYINKSDGKDIICVSTQTLCAQGCKFCHVSDHIGKLVLRNLTDIEIFKGVDLIIDSQDIENDCLLISFMGCGEPLCNVDNVLKAMSWIECSYNDYYDVVRFAIATMIPKNKLHEFYRLCSEIKERNLLAKIHLSLHYTSDTIRSEWMPNALPIQQSIDSLVWVKEYCGVGTEIHYALIDSVNDELWHMITLAKMFEGKDIPIKFLYYNEKDSIDARASMKSYYDTIKECYDVSNLDIETEYYVPPGLDIGASCGQFLLDYYERYNKNE